LSTRGGDHASSSRCDRLRDGDVFRLDGLNSGRRCLNDFLPAQHLTSVDTDHLIRGIVVVIGLIGGASRHRVIKLLRRIRPYKNFPLSMSQAFGLI